jgi:hypothetical protein
MPEKLSRNEPVNEPGNELRPELKPKSMSDALTWNSAMVVLACAVATQPPEPAAQSKASRAAWRGLRPGWAGIDGPRAELKTVDMAGASLRA